MIHVGEGWNNPTVALRVVEGDEKGTRCLGIQLGHPVTGGQKYRDLVLQVGGLDARLTTVICKKIIVTKSKEVKTGWSNSR
jgi:hypothetical protein